MDVLKSIEVQSTLNYLTYKLRIVWENSTLRILKWPIWIWLSFFIPMYV